MNEYTYSGPVMEFDICVAERWTAKTHAASEKRARSNLAYQFKMRHSRILGAKITLPGKLEVTEMTG